MFESLQFFRKIVWLLLFSDIFFYNHNIYEAKSKNFRWLQHDLQILGGENLRKKMQNTEKRGPNCLNYPCKKYENFSYFL